MELLSGWVRHWSWRPLDYDHSRVTTTSFFLNLYIDTVNISIALFLRGLILDEITNLYAMG